MFLAWIILNCLMAIVGLFVLGRYRHRSPKATRIGIVALFAYGTLTLLALARVQFAGRLLEPDSVPSQVASGVLILGNVMCVFALVVAIVTDRKPG